MNKVKKIEFKEIPEMKNLHINAAGQKNWVHSPEAYFLLGFNKYSVANT